MNSFDNNHSTRYNLDDLRKYYKSSCDTILQANKGLPFKVKFIGWYISVNKYGASHVTEYIDGDGKQSFHNVCL